MEHYFNAFLEIKLLYDFVIEIFYIMESCISKRF